ncbi:MICOS complex subunit MIC10, partial [Trichostrongylus colubriformis]
MPSFYIDLLDRYGGFRDYSSFPDQRMTANANWRKEGSRPFRTSEDWRAESSWRRSPSPRRANTSSSHSLRRRSGSRYSPEREDMHRKSSSKGRKSRDKSATREEHSDHLKKGSIRSLDEDELEKAARLQLQLMAEMQSGESKQSPEKPEVTSKKGKEGVVNKEVESSKMGASSKKAKDSAPVTHSDTASPSQKKINPPETDFHSKAQPKEIDGKQPNSDVMPKTGQGETLVLKKNFEDIHMFPRAKVSGGLARSSTQKAWIEQYKMNVNKRKQGLCSGTPMPIARPSSPGRYDIHGGLVPRVPPRLPDYRSEASPTLEIRTATREYFQDPKRPPREEAVYVPAEEVTAKLPVPYATLDPKQFIEELSDSEDWEEVVQLVTKPSTLKRPAGVEIERPVKRGLLGTAPLPQNGPVVTSGRAVRPGLISPPVLTAKPTLPVPRSSVEEKSFFRMEYPSVTPKIYYSHPPIRDEHSNGSSEPAQARIAPAAPLPSGRNTTIPSTGVRSMLSLYRLISKRSMLEWCRKVADTLINCIIDFLVSVPYEFNTTTCFADSLLKISGGIAIGIVASVAFFRSRSWPIWFGSGIGIGTGWSNCRHDLAQPYLLHGRKVPVGTDTEVTKGKPVLAIVKE